MSKSVLVTVLEMPKPAITLSGATELLHIGRCNFGGSRWRDQQITEAQRGKLRSMGVITTSKDFDQYFRGHAADMIDTLVSRPSQREALEYHLRKANELMRLG